MERINSLKPHLCNYINYTMEKFESVQSAWEWDKKTDLSQAKATLEKECSAVVCTLVNVNIYCQYIIVEMCIVHS